MVSWEVAQKCLLFAEGKRGHTLFNGVKCADFPESLLWTESKCGNTGERIAELLDEGKTTYEIADCVGLAQPSVALQAKRIKDKRQFYGEWKGFLESLREIKEADCPIAEVFTAERDRAGVEKSNKKGIVTIADFLSFAVTHDKKAAVRMLATNAERHAFLFAELTAHLKPHFRKSSKKEKAGKDTEFPGQLSIFDLL